VVGHAEVASASKRGIASLVLASATVLIVVTGALASGFSPLAIPFIVWGLLPYGVLYLVGKSVSNPWIVGGAGVAALTVELGVRASVMLFPRASTAAIALVFSPALIGIIVMPLGAAAGAALGYVFARTGFVVRAVSVVAAAIVLGLTFIFFARPELFPSAVAARQRHLSAIGERRVVSGGDRFTRRVESEESAWHLAGEYDGQPGEELALVDHKGAQLVDAATLKRTRFIEFGGEPGRLWNWYSRLVRRHDTFIVVQTGGGYQQTQVRSLNNELLWGFNPDPKLPPTALLPGDLDGDGETEFYASTTNAVTRLDADGRQVWSKPSTLPDIVALAPGEGTDAPWIVSTRYGVSVDLWSPDGTQLAQLPWPGSRVLGVVEWPDTRSVLAGAESVKGIDRDGTTRFEFPLEEPLRLLQAAAWTPVAGGSNVLAIVAGGDRDLNRWRLRVYASPQTSIYDEVFDSVPRLLVVRHADRTSTLFVIVGNALSVMRPTPTTSF